MHRNLRRGQSARKLNGVLESPLTLWRKFCSPQDFRWAVGSAYVRKQREKRAKKRARSFWPFDCLLERGAATPGPRTPFSGRPRGTTTAYSARAGLSLARGRDSQTLLAEHLNYFKSRRGRTALGTLQ